jgi:5'-3' exonuclease
MEKQEAEKKEAQRKAGQGNAKSSEQAKKEAQKAQNQAEQERKKSIAQQKKKAAEEQKKAEQARIEAEKQRKLAQEHERKAAAHQQKLAERTALLQKREQEHVAEIYKQNLNLKEAEAIKRAYIYITMANAVYDGHRWRAMGHLTEAAKILDTKILKNGTDGQKVLALQQDVEAYKTLFLRKQLGGVYEPQILADMQMLVGYKILTEQVRPILLRRGDQPRVLDLVDSAIGQINQAATYRRTGI